MYKKISSTFDYAFTIQKDGIYAITVVASCKSGSILGLFGGEDLRIEIDGIRLREVPAKDKPQYYDIAPSWNGTKLKGLSKTVIFILPLAKGEHTVTFIPKRGATIDAEPEIAVFDAHKPVIKKSQAQDGNRRPWIAIALVDVPLQTVDVAVRCEQRHRDSDDAKLIIDGETQKNEKQGWWGKYWYWRGKDLQGIMHNGNRYWNSWQEAMEGYGPQEKEHNKAIWNIYKNGVDTRQGKRIRLWSVLIFAIISLGLFSWISWNQKQVYFSYKDLGPEYASIGRIWLTVGIFDGVRTKTATLGPVQDYSSGENSGLIKSSIKVDYYDFDNDEVDDVLVSASRFAGNEIMYFFRISKNKLEPFHFINHSNPYSGDDSLYANNIRFGRKDSLGRYTFIEEDMVRYINAPDQIWRTYYRFNENNDIVIDRTEREDIVVAGAL